MVREKSVGAYLLQECTPMNAELCCIGFAEAVQAAADVGVPNNAVLLSVECVAQTITDTTGRIEQQQRLLRLQQN